MSRFLTEGRAVESAGYIVKIKAGDAAREYPEFVPMYAVVGDVELYLAVDGRTRLPMIDVTWTIPPGVAVNNYVLTYQMAQAVPLGPSDLTGNPIQLCFYQGGLHDLTAIGVTSVGVGFAQDTVHVYAPEVVNFSAEIDGWPVAGPLAKNWTLQLGLPLGPDAVGVSFNAEVRSVGTASGTIAFLQLVKFSRYRWYTGGKKYNSLNDIYIIDARPDVPNAPFYGEGIHLPGMGQSRFILVSDSPGLITDDKSATGLLVPDLQFRPDAPPEQFQMYLMFKPDQFNATWAPLAVMAWEWGGSTVFDATSPTRWSDVRDANASVTGVNPYYVYFPTWNYTPANSVYIPYPRADDPER